MKAIILAGLMLVASSAFANEVVGELGDKQVSRFVDPQTNVVCYSTRFDTISCVYVPPKQPRTATQNEDIPE